MKYLWIFILVCIMGFYAAKAEYEAVKNYYPDLTFWEYFLISDKIRITPR